MWDFSKFQELKGEWHYEKDKTFVCNGNENGTYGVGCSNGVDNNLKVLTQGSFNSKDGIGEICQYQPNIWGENCNNATISFKCWGEKTELPGIIMFILVNVFFNHLP